MLVRSLPLLAALLAGCAPTPPRTDADRTLTEHVRGADRLTTLARALDGAGLAETLAGPGPYTLFAPTDAAFAALPAGERARLLEPGSPGRGLLAYHLVPARLGAEDFDGRSVRTVHGAALSLAVRDSGLTVNRRPVLGRRPARNGTLYLIGSVLLPPGAQD